MATTKDGTAEAIRETFISPNESDSNYEPANVVDGLFAIARAIRYLAHTVEQMTPPPPPPPGPSVLDTFDR